MATAGDAFVSKIRCRYFRFGVCSKGSECRYSHSFEPEEPVAVCTLPKVTHSGSGEFSECTNTQVNQDTNSSELSEQDQLSNGDGVVSEPFAAGAVSSVVKFDAAEWVKASEFVPGQPWKGTYCSFSPSCTSEYSDEQLILETNQYDECSGYAAGGASGETPNSMVFDGQVDSSDMYMYSDVVGDDYSNCQFVADPDVPPVEFCDMCGLQLPPLTDEALRNQHQLECIRSHEEEMELSFAVQRSQDKVCGICMEVIWEKEPENMARFGILSNCSHIFCLSCIRRWRAAEQFEKKTVRGCPECRVQSDFVVPSRYWFNDLEEKNKLIGTYKAELKCCDGRHTHIRIVSIVGRYTRQKPDAKWPRDLHGPSTALKKHCKYFKRGTGRCPFNEKCFYLHAYPDGRIASPQPVRRRRENGSRRSRDTVHHVVREDDSDAGSDSDTEGMPEFHDIQPSALYEIIEELNERVARLADQLEHSILRRLTFPRSAQSLLYIDSSDGEDVL